MRLVIWLVCLGLATTASAYNPFVHSSCANNIVPTPRPLDCAQCCPGFTEATATECPVNGGAVLTCNGVPEPQVVCFPHSGNGTTPTAFNYYQSIFVDPFTGSDATANSGHSPTSPLKTLNRAIAVAMSGFGGAFPVASLRFPYTIYAFAGEYVSEPKPLLWFQFINLQGPGVESAFIGSAVALTTTGVSFTTFSDFPFETFTLDSSASNNAKVFFINSDIHSLTYDGAYTFSGGVITNELFLQSATVAALIINSGFVHAYDNCELTGVELIDSTVATPPGTPSSLDIDGGTIQPPEPLVIQGVSQLYLRGVEFATSITATANIFTQTPTMETDAASIPNLTLLPNAGIVPGSGFLVNGPLTIIQEDNVVAFYTDSTILQLETFVMASPLTPAGIVLTLPPALTGELGGNANFVGREIVIKNINPAGNPVIITPFGTDKIDGQSSFVLNVPDQYVGLIAINNAGAPQPGWYIVRNSTVQLFSTITPPAAYQYGETIFVDPINGLTTGTGRSPIAPLLTLDLALASIANAAAGGFPVASLDTPYTVFLYPGLAPAPTTATTWPPFVSLQGAGEFSSLITGTFKYTGTLLSENSATFSEVSFELFHIDVSTSAEEELYVIHCQAEITYVGAYLFGSPLLNQLFIESSTISTLTIFSGFVHVHDNSVLNMVQLPDTTGTGFTQSSLDIDGGLLGGVSIDGISHLYTRGVQFQGTLSASQTGPNIPTWETDASSIPIFTLLPGPSPPAQLIFGPINIIQEDNVALRVDATMVQPILIQLQTVVIVDASLGPVTLQLPPAIAANDATSPFANKANIVGREIIIKRIDLPALLSPNSVLIVPQAPDFIDGFWSSVNPLPLTVQDQFVGLITNGDALGPQLGWYIVRNSTVQLLSGLTAQYQYGEAIFVDPIDGLLTGTGRSPIAPLKTLDLAIASIANAEAGGFVPASVSTPYTIFLAPGGATTITTPTWPAWVSLQGSGKFSSYILGSVPYTGTPGSAVEISFSDANLNLMINVSTSLAEKTYVTNCIGAITYTGAYISTDSSQNELFVEASTVETLFIKSGFAHVYDNSNLIGAILADNTSPGSPITPSFLDVDGGRFEGELGIAGVSILYTRGVEFQGLVIATAHVEGATTYIPTWETDAASLPNPTLLPNAPSPTGIIGPINVIQEDQVILYAPAAVLPYNLQLQTFVFADASTGNVVIRLPPALSTTDPGANLANFVGREIVIKRIDTTTAHNPPFTVSIVPQTGEKIDGVAYTLASGYMLTFQDQYVGLIAPNIPTASQIGWFIVRNSTVQLFAPSATAANAGRVTILPPAPLCQYGGYEIAATPTTAGPISLLGAAQTYGLLSGATLVLSQNDFTPTTVFGNLGANEAPTTTAANPLLVTGSTQYSTAAYFAAIFAAGSAQAIYTSAAFPCTTLTFNELGGQTLLPGTYCNPAGSAPMTLTGLSGALVLQGSGSANDFWLFKFQNVSFNAIGPGAIVTMAGPDPGVISSNDGNGCNVIWVAESFTASSDFNVIQGVVIASNFASIVSTDSGLGSQNFITGGIITLAGPISIQDDTFGTAACTGGPNYYCNTGPV
jgi:hypothetical protein